MTGGLIISELLYDIVILFTCLLCQSIKSMLIGTLKYARWTLKIASLEHKNSCDSCTAEAIFMVWRIYFKGPARLFLRIAAYTLYIIAENNAFLSVSCTYVERCL